MNPDQAKRLGLRLRTRRRELGLSSTEVAAKANISQATIVRLEQGFFSTPDPAKLQGVAAALDLNLTDVLSLAGYPVPELPNVGPYLRTKFRDLPDRAVDQLQAEVGRVLRLNGIEPNDGPRDGEDEQPEDHQPLMARQSTKKQKGGSSP